jgi:hypothetical protein
MIRLSPTYFVIDGDYVDMFSTCDIPKMLFETRTEAEDYLRNKKLERIAELERELKKLKEDWT